MTSVQGDTRQPASASVSPLPAASSLHRQTFLAVDAIELLVIHAHALAFQQYADPSIAEPTPLASNLLHCLSDIGTVRRAFMPDSLGVDTDKPAGPALRD